MIKNFLPAHQNPFSVQKTTAISYRFDAGDWQTHFSRLQQLQFRAAIVGLRGSGKSTLLKSLHLQLERRGIPNLLLPMPHNNEQHQLLVSTAIQKSISSGSIILVDGIERLSLPSRFRLLRSKHLVAAVHRTQKFPFLRLPTWIETRTNLDLLRHILVKLNQSQSRCIETQAGLLFDAHEGNIREVLRDLYDLKASGKL